MICRTLFVIFLMTAAASAAEAQCGIERWPVKTATDSDSQYVSRAAVPTTIAQLRAIQSPRPLLQANRMAPVEETIYSVTATLIAVKSEEDSDYRLVLADGEGRTIIAEIPSPSCSNGGAFASDIAGARAAFDAKLVVPSDRLLSVGIPVEVHGVGFFDFLDGQPGSAPNGIELHPVTSINFSPLIPPAPPEASRRRAVTPVGSGHTTCTTPALTLALSAKSACPGSPVTLSWKASDPAASVVINGLGTALPSSGTTTIGSTTAILYSGRAANGCGSGNEAVTVLSIDPPASASLTGPASLEQGSSGTLSVSVAHASVWSLTSSLGNSISPSSGSNNGSFAVQYLASKSGGDVITLSATNACGSTQTTTPVSVISATPQPQPQPQPQPGGLLRCCDGTISPSCTSCANKQGCCSHHGGVCGC